MMKIALKIECLLFYQPTGELTKQLVGPKSTNMQTYIESCSNKVFIYMIYMI